MNFYIWRDRIVESLLGLSDTVYQRFAWTKVIDSSDTSPDEMLVTLLDDWAFARFASDNRERLNDWQVQRVKSLLDALLRYKKTEPDYDGNMERVFASNAWCEVVSKSRDLYVALCPRDSQKP